MKLIDVTESEKIGSRELIRLKYDGRTLEIEESMPVGLIEIDDNTYFEFKVKVLGKWRSVYQDNDRIWWVKEK